MGYASQSGRARTSATSPRAHAICDRCGFRYNFADLKWQMEWRGATLQNIRILVCQRCLDTPQENLRSIVLPADPEPIINARVQDFLSASSDFFLAAPVTTDPVTGLPVIPNNYVTGPDGVNLVNQPIGAPSGREIAGQAPLVATVNWDTPISLLSLNSDGSKTVTATTNGAHGLQSGAQVGIQGSRVSQSDGIFSVTVITAVSFSYIVAEAIAAASLLVSTTIAATAKIGVPRGWTSVPVVMKSSNISVGAFLLLENGGIILLENGDRILVENAPIIVGSRIILENGLGFVLLQNGSYLLEG